MEYRAKDACGTEYTIVAAKTEEFPTIHALYRSVFGQEGCTWDDSYPDAEILTADISRGDLFCAKNADGEAIAAIVLDYDPAVEELTCWDPELQPVCEVMRLVVRQDYQNRSIARMMLTFGMQEVKRRGFAATHFLVSQTNERALHSYAKLGFHNAGEAELFGNKWFCYEKDLRGMFEEKAVSRRFMLVVAYDGTRYCGWQVQPNAITVEEVLNRELSALLHEPIEVIGASRTDSGVHAMGNVAVFDSVTRIPAEKLCYALNRSLPEDIVVQKSFEVLKDFHPRKWDSRKTYEYKIWNADFVQPFLRHYAHFVYRALDVEKMRKGAEYLLGTHDFTSFCSTKTQSADHVRTITSIDIKKEDRLITIRITGNGFLYNMVRIITGTLLLVGEGLKQPEDVKEMLAACNREAAGPTAPANGLALVGIENFPDPAVRS